MKKILCTVLFVVAFNAAARSIPSQKELEKTMTGIHNKTFSKSNLYSEQLDAREWNDVLALTHDFVKEHAFHNKSLMRSYKKIKQASDDLTSEIRIAYSTLFRTKVNRGEHHDSQKLIKRFSTKFESIENEMSTLQTKLKAQMDNKKLLLHGQDKVATVLHRLAMSVKLSALKARNDLAKYRT